MPRGPVVGGEFSAVNVFEFTPSVFAALFPQQNHYCLLGFAPAEQFVCQLVAVVVSTVGGTLPLPSSSSLLPRCDQRKTSSTAANPSRFTFEISTCGKGTNLTASSGIRAVVRMLECYQNSRDVLIVLRLFQFDEQLLFITQTLPRRMLAGRIDFRKLAKFFEQFRRRPIHSWLSNCVTASAARSASSGTIDRGFFGDMAG